MVRPVNHSEPEFPLEDERAIHERPPWEPRTRLEMERDISQLRARDKQIGDSLGWIVDTLLQDEDEAKDKQRLKKERREAVESLAYIRDVLISDAMELEGDRLVGEDEASRRRARIQRQESISTRVTGPSPRPRPPKTMSPPVPLPLMDSRPKMTGNRPRSQGSLPGTPFSLSPIPPTQASTETGGGPTLAPWNYTRSSFSGTTVLPPTSLPRPPPPTSRKPANQRLSDQSPREESTGYSDPLGAMR